jgi:peptide-methionine (R)-S-oxide reductase
MNDLDPVETLWKKKLSKELFEILREGKIEAPHTGGYVHTNITGTYRCVACRAPVFNSFSKYDDGSGYATFKVTPLETAVKLSRTYSPEGDELTRVLCSVCDSKLGFVDGDDMRSASELEQGGKDFQLVRINSQAIVLKKSFTVYNYPFWYLILLGLLLVAGYFISTWARSVVSVAQYEGVAGELRLWVGEDEVVAKTLNLKEIDLEAQSMVFGQDAIFVILSKAENAPQIRPTNQPVDIVWLSDSYRVVQYEQQVTLLNNEVLTAPEEAVFALVTRPGYLPSNTFNIGFSVLVIDKSELF